MSVKGKYLSDFPNLLNEFDYELNINIDVTTITAGSSLKIWWVCTKKNHKHSWETEVKKRTIQNRNCPYCANQKACNNCNSINFICPEILVYFDYSKNNIDPSNLIAGSDKKVWWICNKLNHEHSWESPIRNMIKSGGNCIFCNNKKICNKCNSLEILFPELISEYDLIKNNELPSNIIPGSHKKYWWKCVKNHSWEAVIKSRCYGTKAGCPICNISKGEQKCYDVLSNNINIKNIYPQYKFNNCKYKRELPFDFYIELKNNKSFCLEYNGIQHYKPINIFGGEKTLIQQNMLDDIKKTFCYDNSIQLLVISYIDFENIELIINNFINLIW